MSTERLTLTAYWASFEEAYVPRQTHPEVRRCYRAAFLAGARAYASGESGAACLAYLDAHVHPMASEEHRIGVRDSLVAGFASALDHADRGEGFGDAFWHMVVDEPVCDGAP